MKNKILQALDETPKPVIKHFKIWTGVKFRHVAEPHEPLKSQLADENDFLLDIYERLLEEKGLTDIPQAYRLHHGVHTNAVLHHKNKIWYRFDFKSFYDTVRFEDFADAIVERYSNIWKKRSEYESCFIDPATQGLIQGSPASGTLAGIALIPFWLELKKALPNAVITQYSDDLCISGVDNMSMFEVQTIVINSIVRSGLKVRLNSKKTRVDKNQYRCLTGVACNHEDKVTCYRKDYRLFRAILNRMRKSDVDDVLKENEMSALQFMGRLNYAKLIDETGKMNRLIGNFQTEFLKLKILCMLEQKYRKRSVTNE